jgi:hypothetical protein
MPNQKNLLPNPVASVPFLFVWIFTIPSCSHTRRQKGSWWWKNPSSQVLSSIHYVHRLGHMNP